MIVDSREYIQDIASVGGMEYEQFTSAADIQGNFKIHFIEALERLPSRKRQTVGEMAEMLEDVDAISGVPSGGLELARSVAKKTKKSFIEVVKCEDAQGKKDFKVVGRGLDIIKDEPKIGEVEDVTSTAYSLMLAADCLNGLVIKSVVGIRRGMRAWAGMSKEDIMFYNKKFPYRVPLEYDLPFPNEALVTRYLPLWMEEQQIQLWLPELGDRRWKI